MFHISLFEYGAFVLMAFNFVISEFARTKQGTIVPMDSQYIASYMKYHMLTYVNLGKVHCIAQGCR